MERIKLDCHVHSKYSKDSRSSLAQIEAQRMMVAITDHNVIAEETLKTNFIIGEEILTGEENLKGKKIEVGALFIQETIPSGLSLLDTLYAISQQDGLVVLVHPYDERRHGAGESESRWVINYCKERKIPVAVEVLNARATLAHNRQAAELRRNFPRVLATAGSDAHREKEVGRAYVGIPLFKDKNGFLESLSQAQIYGECRPIATVYHRLLTKLTLLQNR